MSLCPYCLEKEGISRDHIFPAFLGGSRKVPACRECNSGFGASIEARLHMEVAPMQVMLSTNGFAEARPNLAWPRAYRDADQIEYDLYPNFVMRPTGTHVIPLERGGNRIVASDKKTVRKVAAGFSAAGKGKYPDEATSHSRPLHRPHSSWRIPINEDMTRLGVKTSLALMKSMDFDVTGISEELRRWLRDQSGGESPDARYGFAAPSTVQYSDRPSQYVYVEGSHAHGTLIGIFRAFDVISVSILLSGNYEGPDFAISGRLDLVDLTETFQRQDASGIAMPPRLLLRCVAGLHQVQALQRLDRFTERHFGRVRMRFAPWWLHANLMMRPLPEAWTPRRYCNHVLPTHLPVRAMSSAWRVSGLFKRP